MATDDRSPSMFCGQSWASWADKMSITDGNDDENDSSAAKDEGDSMKLNMKDKDLYGFCPQIEELLLVQCEVCDIWVKPQALKQHTLDRHGSVESVKTTSETEIVAQMATDKALNSELAKKLVASLPGFGKSSAASKPPTKASLKQVPSTLRLVGSSRSLKKSNTNPVVKVERISKEVEMKRVTAAPLSLDFSASRTVMSSVPTSVMTSTSVLSSIGKPLEVPTESSSKSLTNGIMLKKAILSGRPPLPVSSLAANSVLVPVTCVATQPPALTATTTTTSVTYTRPTTSISNLTSTSTATFALLSSKSSSKPLACPAVLSSALAATLTAAHPLRPTPRSSSLTATIAGSKCKKSPKERKFLPCKDREFDANKHCGVVMEDTGKPCTRSLTCKTHALGLRRAVPGRKKSFDDLLKEHKAAKEALLKAKAEEQGISPAGALPSHVLPMSSSGSVTAASSPAALAAMSAVRLGHPDMLIGREIKPLPGLLSRSLKPASRASINTVFQKLTAVGCAAPNLTVKEESSVSDASGRLLHLGEKEDVAVQEKPEVVYLNRHPKPAAVCTFGARIAGSGCALFSRSADLVRAAFLSITEKPSSQPPYKKLCVESKLPREQSSGSSKDPYEFSGLDAGLAHQRQTVSFTIGGPVTAGLQGKHVLKHKPKTLTTQSLSGVSVSNLTVSSAAPTTIIPTLAAALLKPTKGQELLTGNSSTMLPRATLALPQTFTAHSLKRKHSGSAVSGNGSGHGVAAGAIQLQGSSLGLTVSTAPVSMVGHVPQQQQAGAGVTVTSSHSATTPLTAITIPGVNLPNAAIGLSATLPTTKQHVGQGQKLGSINLKDINFVLTGVDTSGVVNGQYLNISGAQLAELAAAQAVTATAEDKNIKRSRLANAKHSTHTLRTLQHGCLTAVPPNAVLVDGTTLQGAVLTPVSLAGGGGGGAGNSAFVALSSGTITTCQSGSITVAPNAILRTVSVGSGAPQQVTFASATFPNGLIPASGDKVHVTAGSAQQVHRLVNSMQGRATSASAAKAFQASGLLQAQGSSLCPSPGLTQLAHFKPSAFNITKGGKLTMQPVSVTIPLVSPMGLSSLNPATQQQQNPHQHPHHGQPTLLVSTSAVEDGRTGGSGGVGRTEIHLQPQMPTASSGAVS